MAEKKKVDAEKVKSKSKKDSMEYGSLGKRFLAFVLDGIILGVTGGIIGGVIGFVVAIIIIPSDGDIEVALAALQPVLNLIGFVIGLVYLSLLESSAWQATLGKKIMGLKVVDDEGKKISVARSFGRSAFKLVSMPFTLYLILLTVFFNDKKKAVHDMVANTNVVKA